MSTSGVYVAGAVRDAWRVHGAMDDVNKLLGATLGPTLTMNRHVSH